MEVTRKPVEPSSEMIIRASRRPGPLQNGGG